MTIPVVIFFLVIGGAIGGLFGLLVIHIFRVLRKPIPQKISKGEFDPIEGFLRSPFCRRMGRFFLLVTVALLGHYVLLFFFIRSAAAAEGLWVSRNDWPLNHGPWLGHFLGDWLFYWNVMPFIATFFAFVSLALKPSIKAGLFFAFLTIGSFVQLLKTFWLVD